ncbi:hypothetical protein T07_12216 [Trichinella nelsoni]|uniref:Uncharacterized protein n=1 Tax=Trichinella nelsoni TaxID=6336 RepID=A0A0V0RJ03_9BILA|nr:hypothetical protein T07_12216 [Trichinella nelsoni]
MFMTACVCSQELSRQWAARSKRIIWLFSSAIQITIDVSKLPHLRPSLISQWPFGVLVRQAASSKYLVDNRHNGVNSHCHPSTSAHGVSLTPTGAAICRDNDLADGVWVLFFLRSRLLGTIGAGGVTPTGLVTFRTEHEITNSRRRHEINKVCTANGRGNFNKGLEASLPCQ